NASTVVNIAGGTSGSSSGASGVVIGNATTAATQTNLQLDSANGSSDVGTCSATVNQGSMYYSTATNTIRACSYSAWSDVVTSADMGLQAFGVVTTSGSNPGDLVPVTGFNNGPCKVAITGTTQVTVSACTAYSGGRKVVVTSTNLAVTTVASTTEYQWVCLTGTNGAPAITADSTSQTANQPTFSATAPVVCLARVESNGGLLNLTPSINALIDVRPFSTAVMTAVNIVTTAPTPGMLVKLNGTLGQYVPTSATSDVIAGVVLATDGSTTANTINAIIALSGPVNIRASAGTVNQYILPTTTAGVANTNATAGATIYNNAGVAQSSFSNTCSNNADNCRAFVFTNLNIR
ncbi:MAG TPA: hypothetical protein VLF41_02870, partial [Candidatus Nanoarchaeia archaeon]|nr:hypothetical protein [Candidatus Nanoarchaeia archaeon]